MRHRDSSWDYMKGREATRGKKKGGEISETCSRSLIWIQNRVFTSARGRRGGRRTGEEEAEQTAHVKGSAD